MERQRMAWRVRRLASEAAHDDADDDEVVDKEWTTMAMRVLLTISKTARIVEMDFILA